MRLRATSVCLGQRLAAPETSESVNHMSLCNQDRPAPVLPGNEFGCDDGAFVMVACLFRLVENYAEPVQKAVLPAGDQA